MDLYRVAVLLVVALSLCRTAHAQTAPDFLAADIFGGVGALAKATPTENPEGAGAVGWTVGGTVRIRPWWGLKGDVVRTHDDNARQFQYVGGLEVASPISGEFGSRGFAHVLAGYIRNRSRQGVLEGSPEVVMGAGFDTLFVFRMEFDYVRLNLPSLPKNNARILVGGVLPLCFTGCRPDGEDGIHIGRP
jgi:hypothetical protein